MSASAEEVAGWHPGPGTRWFRPGDEVRLDGERSSSYRIRSFGVEGDGVEVVEVFGRRSPNRAPMVRTVRAERLRRLPARALRPR